MILGYLIIGMATGFVATIATLIAGWGIGFALLAYCGTGMVSVLLLALLAFALPGRREPMLQAAGSSAS